MARCLAILGLNKFANILLLFTFLETTISEGIREPNNMQVSLL